MPTLRVPALLKYYLDDQNEVRLEGQTVGEVLGDLSQKYPKIHSHIFDNSGQVRRHINLFVNADNIRDLQGLGTPVRENDIIKILPSITGGGECIRFFGVRYQVNPNCTPDTTPTPDT